MKQRPDYNQPRGTVPKFLEACEQRRLKLVFCKHHQDQSLYSKSLEKRARHDRFAELGNLAAVFAHEVANPLNGLSASLQFAVKDLANLTSNGLAKKETDIPILQETLQGALQEVSRLGELLSDFRLAVTHKL